MRGCSEVPTKPAGGTFELPNSINCLILRFSPRVHWKVPRKNKYLLIVHYPLLSNGWILNPNSPSRTLSISQMTFNYYKLKLGEQRTHPFLLYYLSDVLVLPSTVRFSPENRINFINFTKARDVEL